MGLLQQLAGEAERAMSLHNEYRKLLSLLAEIKSGQTSIEHVHIDMRNESWEFRPEKKDPEPSINGLDRGTKMDTL